MDKHRAIDSEQQLASWAITRLMVGLPFYQRDGCVIQSTELYHPDIVGIYGRNGRATVTLYTGEQHCFRDVFLCVASLMAILTSCALCLLCGQHLSFILALEPSHRFFCCHQKFRQNLQLSRALRTRKWKCHWNPCPNQALRIC